MFGRHFDNVTHAEFADAIADALTLALPTDSLESMLITRIAELAQGTSALPATPTDAVGMRFEVEVLAKSEAVALAMPQPILTVLFAQELTMALQGVMVHKSPAHVSSVGVQRVRLGVLTELATICCTVDQIGRLNVYLNTLTPLVVTDACIACVVAIPRDFGPVIVPNVLPPQVMQRKQKDKSETHPIVIVVIVFLCVIAVAAAAEAPSRARAKRSLSAAMKEFSSSFDAISVPPPRLTLPLLLSPDNLRICARAAASCSAQVAPSCLAWFSLL